MKILSCNFVNQIRMCFKTTSTHGQNTSFPIICYTKKLNEKPSNTESHVKLRYGIATSTRAYSQQLYTNANFKFYPHVNANSWILSKLFQNSTRPPLLQITANQSRTINVPTGTLLYLVELYWTYQNFTVLTRNLLYLLELYCTYLLEPFPPQIRP